MKFKEELGRLGLRLLFYPRFKFKFTYENFSRRRKEPYVLLANHASLNDPLYIGMNLVRYPYPVASNTLYTHPVTKFLLTKVITSIPKRKGQNDIQTIRSIIKAFKDDQRGVMLFPEGNSSYFGEETKVDYESTAKLIKKIGEDVIYGNISGGFFANPRWGKFRRRGTYQCHYAPLLSKSELKALSVEEIAKVLEKTIVFNDYDWNREKQIKYHSHRKAEGLEHYLYYCPVCGNIQTIYTKHNDIYCDHCGKIGHINAYEFLEGLPFDNLVAWDKLQQSKIPEIIKKPIHTTGEMMMLDFAGSKRIKLGEFSYELNQKRLKALNAEKEYDFFLNDISGLVLTQKQFLSFDYEDQTYMIRAQDPMILLNAINYIKGEV